MGVRGAYVLREPLRGCACRLGAELEGFPAAAIRASTDSAARRRRHVEIATSSAYSLLLYSDLDAVDAIVGGGASRFGQRVVPEVVGHLESMLESGELADVVLVCAGDLEVQGHGVVLLSVPYLCAAIRELRHKRLDDSELMTVQLPDCEQAAVRSALRFTYSGNSRVRGLGSLVSSLGLRERGLGFAVYKCDSDWVIRAGRRLCLEGHVCFRSEVDASTAHLLLASPIPHQGSMTRRKPSRRLSTFCAAPPRYNWCRSCAPAPAPSK